MLELIEGLYAVATNPSGWADWLSALRGELSADAAALVFRFEPRSGHHGCVASGFSEDQVRGGAVDAMRTRAVRPADADPCLGALADDPRLFSQAVNLGAGEVLVLSEILPEAQFIATRFHRECLQPRQLHHVVCATVDRAGDQITSLSLMRRAGEPRFTAAELDRLRQLHPHLQRVTRLQETIVAAQQQSKVAERVLECVRSGVILLDASGRVCGTNRRAAALLERGEGLVRERGRLLTENPHETPALRKLLCGAIGSEAPRAGGVLAVSRAAPTHPLFVSVSPIDSDEGPTGWLGGPRVLVLLNDPEDLSALAEDDLCGLYGLTAAEARVAARVAAGETLDEIAAALGVGRATVRSHLQQALAKTGTHRQVDLARLLLAASPPRFGP